jgi:hypothetical protein
MDFPETVAAEISALSASVKKLRAGRLNERALVLLIHDALPTAQRGGKVCGLPAIREVLSAAEDLEALFLKKTKVPI